MLNLVSVNVSLIGQLLDFSSSKTCPVCKEIQKQFLVKMKMMIILMNEIVQFIHGKIWLSI